MSVLTLLIFVGATLLLIGCAIYIWLVRYSAESNRALTLFCLLIVVGNTGQIFSRFALDVISYAFWYRVSWLGWALFPATAIHFALLLADYPRMSRRRWLYPLLYLPGCVFTLRNIFVLTGISGIHITEIGRLAPTYAHGLWDTAFTLYQYAFNIVALAIIAHASFNSGSRRRNRQAIVILLTAFLAVVPDLLRRLFAPASDPMLYQSIAQVIFVVGLLYAVTRLKFAAPTAALAAGAIVERVKDLVLLTTPDRVILQVNPAALALLGWKEAEMAGHPLDDFLRPAEDDPTIQPAPENGSDPSREVNLLTREGELIPVWKTSSQVRDAHGDVIGIVVVAEDLRYTKALRAEIAERHKAEEALLEADKAKDYFLAALSHELLTPLAAILIWTRLAKSDPTQLPQALGIIEDNANHQQRIVEDMLDVSRLIHGKLELESEPLDASELVWQCVEQFRHDASARGIELTFIPSAAPAMVLADMIRLRQVATNLLGNALKYTPAGGSVTVTVSVEDDHAVIRVKDTGTGIAAEDMADLFTPFKRGRQMIKAGGMGLGLAVVKGILDLHEGTIAAESHGEGCGCVFTVTLPLIDAPPAPE